MDKNQVYNDEMEQMRQDMSELRSLLSEQKIVNERLMRRAMKSELDKERRVTLQTLLPSLFTLPLFYFMQPLWGLPLWFVWVTIAYLLLAVVFSIWSVRRLTGEGMGCMLLPSRYVGLLGGEGYQPAYYMIPPKYRAWWALSVVRLREAYLSRAAEAFLASFKAHLTEDDF